MGLAFIARDRAVKDAKEARKVEATSKLEAYSLRRRLDRSNEINRCLFLDYKNLMGAWVEMSRKHCEDLAGINTFLVDLSQRQAELRLAALKDRLADVDKLKTRYQRQIDVLSAKSYRSGWENREFEGHAEVVTPDQFDDQKEIERDHYSVKYYMQQLRDEISITYPADVLKMLAPEKEGPSTSAPGAIELVPASGPPDRTSEVLDAQPSLGVSTGEGSGAVIVSSDKSDLATPPFSEAGPSAGVGRAPSDGGN
ncbi:hypothetical protein PanWU01x14_094500 [Parasponia andersonii]|uniref:Uncharacterized protein n=1 Tax=Parasponia andersonii TaxID=3476 RepID=A0A2P5D5R4_PARAD|nr:hypothetical protein PanWU01x14_094500 [Parasponia andersonii]